MQRPLPLEASPAAQGSSDPSGLLKAIGATPLVELRALSPRPGVRIFAKVEGQNPSGSVKDRIALAMILDLERRFGLRPGATLVEASTGNTAIALALVARQRGYQLKVVVPEGVVPSIADALDLLGVELLWSKPRAGMGGAMEDCLRLASAHGWVPVGQFTSPVNVAAHYHTTGLEIASALDEVHAFVAGIGTGGTLMGVGRRLRERWPDVRLIGVEPHLGERLQGLRSLEEGFRPPLLDLDLLNGRFLVSAERALSLCQRVAREEGLLAGVSSGATLHAALRVAERMERGNVVVMFSDSGWKYLPARPWRDAIAHDPCLSELHWW